MKARIVCLAVVVSAALHAQSPPVFERGAPVRVRDVAKPAVLRIVGLPDEIVQVDESGVYVNDVPVAGFSPEFLQRNRWPRQIIPFGHYFVIGEERVDGVVNEYLGVHPEDAIERAP
jgi:hypothetical protein